MLCPSFVPPWTSGQFTVVSDVGQLTEQVDSCSVGSFTSMWTPRWIRVPASSACGLVGSVPTAGGATS